MGKVLVTIFVTCYNAEKFLEQFFDSVSKQTYRDYQLLILDDGSTDKSLSICRAHAEKDSRIKVVANEHVGIANIRNTILGMLDTEFAVSLDVDDYFEPDYLKHLMDAQKKYDADYVISNVIYVNQEGDETSRLTPRKEAFFTKEQLPDILPELLEEDRLNYFYTKLYRTNLLKDIRVDPNIKYAEDTVINMQYVLRINNLAVIENYDYRYVKYTTHSVTANLGKELFWSLYKVNKYLCDLTDQNGLLNDKMQCAIDRRILLSGTIALRRIGSSDENIETRLATAHKIINSDEYLQSYNRLKEKGQLETLNFDVIHPGEEEAFIQHVRQVSQEIKKRYTKKKILEHLPKPLFNAYHSIKKKLGLIP